MDKVVVDAITAVGNVKDDSLVGTIYKDLAQPAIKAIGAALGTTLEFCTAPLLIMKFGSEAAKLNYAKHMNNYAKKLEEIPEADRKSVDPQIGVPIIEKLTYVTNEEIANLFTNLLAKASSTTTANEAHPAFIQIIERLSPDEARLLASLKSRTGIPYIGLNGIKETSYTEILHTLTDFTFNVDFAFPFNLQTYLDNLISVGILSKFDGKSLTDENLYNRLIELHNIEATEQALIISQLYISTERTKGLMKTTAFGESFIQATIA